MHDLTPNDFEESLRNFLKARIHFAPLVSLATLSIKSINRKTDKEF